MKGNNQLKAKTVYPKLIERCIPLSQTPISSRVFMDWRNDKLINYPHPKSDKREWVQLNFFEYIWIVICNELRNYGMSKSHIIGLKELLIEKTLHQLLEENEVDINKVSDNIKEYSKDIVPEEELKDEDFNNFMNNPIDVPEEDHYYVTGIGGLIVLVLFSNVHPILTIHTHDKNAISVDCVIIDSSNSSLEHMMSAVLTKSALTIPIRPILEEFLESDKKENFVNRFQLLNEWETNVIDLIRSGDFKELTITKNESEDGEKLVVKRTTKSELIGANVKEIKKLFGLKNYKKVEVTYRNDKHVYFENTVIEDI